MKKNIDNKRLDEMLTNIYKSEPSHTFQYNCNNIPDENKENTVYTKTVISGSEHIRKNGMTPSKLSAIAAACVIAVTGGIYINRNSFMENMPAAQFEQDEQQENTLFEEYLEEFEYETANFDYQCIAAVPCDKVNPMDMGIDNVSYFYEGVIADGAKVMPEYDNCLIYNENNTNSADISEDGFYLYVKYVTETDDESGISTPIFTRQSYAVWKDSDGNITKIRPSAEKVTADNIENRKKPDDVICKEIVGKLYIDDDIAPVSVSSVIYVMKDDILTPVEALILDNTDYTPDQNAEMRSNISDTAHLFFECSAENKADITCYIKNLNENYWLDEAECEKEYLKPEKIEKEEKSLFEEYLEEFEKEMETYGDKYECLKVSPNGYFSDDPNVRGQNLEFAQICYNKIPECSNAVLCYDKETHEYYAETDEEFYFYVKCLSIPYSNYLRNVYTRQAYLVWKDENGNITKIIPSAEKYDTENINVDDFYDSLDKSDIIEPLIKDLISEFHDETTDVYFDDVLVRPAIEDKYASKNPPSVYCTSDYYTMFINDDNKIVPVTSVNVHYSTDSVMFFDDEYCENVKDIPFFDGEIDEDGFVIMNKTFIYDCSGDELIDISAKIERMNENYWLEEAAYSPDYSNNQETVNEQQTNDSDLFTLTDIVEMSNEQIEQYMDKFGDGLTRKEDNSGYNLCSYCLEQQGYDLHDIKIFDDADLTMSADEVNDIICEHNVAPDEEIHWVFTKENILEVEHDKYRLTVHYRTPKENMTAEEKALNESFHNCVWAELTIF